MSDRLDGGIATERRRSARPLAAAALAASLALVGGCGPLNPAALPPVPPGPGVPCTREVAVAASDVVVAAAACNPWCIHVPAGTPVYFHNLDRFLYLFTADPALPYDVQLPPLAPAVTLPLAKGTVTWTAVQAPSATVTVFVE